ncbi:MAG: hypothetical protein K0R51_332 [Cytophagaceae bacterium]|jgi:hypothetical protein|nr:hypothetical protein [Cytophagaceae bacterium]
MLQTRPLKETEKQILTWTLKKVRRNEIRILLAMYSIFYVIIIFGLFRENPPESFYSAGYTLIRTFLLLFIYVPFMWIFIKAGTLFTILPIKKDIKRNICSITTMLMTQDSEKNYFVGSYTADGKRKYSRTIKFTKKTLFYIPASALYAEKSELKTSDVYQYIREGKIYEVEFGAASHIIFSIKEFNTVPEYAYR